MSELEANFAVWLRHEARSDDSIAGWVREHVFHPTRKWRLDFAWLPQMVAVEVEGILWSGLGRHQQRDGFVKDCEKYEAAAVLGWIVYRVPGPWIVEGDRRIWRPEVIDTLRVLLARHEYG